MANYNLCMREHTNKKSAQLPSANRNYGSNKLTPLVHESKYVKFINCQLAGFFPAQLLCTLLNIGAYLGTGSFSVCYTRVFVDTDNCLNAECETIYASSDLPLVII